jgi:hypothetical protein
MMPPIGHEADIDALFEKAVRERRFQTTLDELGGVHYHHGGDQTLELCLLAHQFKGLHYQRQLIQLLEAQRRTLANSEEAGQLLCRSVYDNSIPILFYLFGIGVSKSFVDKALTVVVEYSRDLEFAEALFSFGASVHVRIENISLLRYAVLCRASAHLIPLLIAEGADVEETGAAGFSLLLEACGSLNRTAVGLLIQGGANVNAVSSVGANALHITCHRTQEKDDNAWREAIVSLLLQSGVSPLQPNDEGLTPLDFARHFGHSGAVALMEKSLVK